MSGKNALQAEYPQYKEQINKLKQRDNYFSLLFSRYHEIDHEIHCIEQGTEICSDDYLEEQKTQLLLLKDDLYLMLKATETTS